ncbi:MAG: MBOAT family protein, partial [Lachnospiraceae bacterium]|nr:MBOAT family protein [Lachnospiraceae bacterium]
LNLLVVWALTGLWHGAAWNFLLWGIVFFLLISLEKRTYGKWLENSRVLGHLYTILLLPVTWIIFAITDMGQLAAYLGNLIGYHREAILVGTTQLMRYLKEYGALLIACVIFATPLPGKLYHKWRDRWFMVLILLAVFWFSVRGIIRGDNNPFLYFRF